MTVTLLWITDNGDIKDCSTFKGRQPKKGQTDDFQTDFNHFEKKMR